MGNKRDQTNIANCVSGNGIERLWSIVFIAPSLSLSLICHLLAIRRCWPVFGRAIIIFVEGARTRSTDSVPNQILIYIFN